MTPVRELALGDAVGRYLLVEQLGSGGMGVVFRAKDPQLGRSVAIKVLRDHTDDRAARLIREAQAMAQLSHENLVVVYDAGTDGGAVFLAMELVDGMSMRQWLGEPGRSWRERLRGVLAAGRGLAAAHAAGIVHRDFKPENVLVDRAGRIKVADFGLARAEQATSPVMMMAPAPNTRDLTRTGSLMGTPAYMSPEQYDGKLADARSDQFALAITAWEAIWDTRPFQGEYLALVDAIKEGRIERSSAPAGERVPAQLEAVLRRALAVDPAARFPTVEALLDAIADALRPPRRWPIGVAAGAIAIAAGVVVVWQAGVFEHAPPLLPGDAIAMTIETQPEPDEFRDIIRSHNDELAACEPPTGYGTVKVGFKVGPPGHVSSLEIVDDGFPRNPAVASCVLRSATGWQFEPGTRSEFVIPLNFGKRPPAPKKK